MVVRNMNQEAVTWAAAATSDASMVVGLGKKGVEDDSAALGAAVVVNSSSGR